MTQNTSSAVMQQRSEPRNSLDDFPTPPWATRALLDYLQRHDLMVRALLDLIDMVENLPAPTKPVEAVQ